MVVKLFGTLDLIAGIIFILVQWEIGLSFATVIAIYLIIKSLIFFGGFASAMDLLAGIYLLLIVFGVHNFFAFIFALWLLQKAFFSLFV